MQEEYGLPKNSIWLKNYKEITGWLRESQFGISLPSEEKSINILGRVIYCGDDEDNEDDIKNQCIGVHFLDISPNYLSRIDKYVQSSLNLTWVESFFLSDLTIQL